MAPTVPNEISTSDVLDLEPVPDGARSRVTVDSILRRLPGARLTVKANADDRPILLKIFRGKGSAKRAEEEAKAAQRLAASGVAVPNLLGIFRVTAKGDTGESLMACGFEWIDAAPPLDRALLKASPSDRRTMADLVAADFKKIEAARLLHRDPHPGNFLWTGEKIVWVDATAVKKTFFAPSTRARIEARVAFVAALTPSADDEFVASFFENVENARSLHRFDPRSAINRRRRELLVAFAQKMLRTNTRARVEKSEDHLVYAVADREVGNAVARIVADRRPIDARELRRALPGRITKVDIFPFDGDLAKAIPKDLLRSWQIGLFLDARGIRAPRIDAVVARRIDDAIVELIVAERPTDDSVTPLDAKSLEEIEQLLSAFGLRNAAGPSNLGRADQTIVVRSLDGVTFA